MPDIDINQLGEAINDKMDRDLNNRSDDSGLRKLVESYNNGADWYKIFNEIQSDGTVKQWCEQGGIIALTTGSVTLNFLKAFTDTNYNLMMTDYQSGYPVILSKSDSSASVKSSNNVNADWKAEGYIS